MRTSSTLFAVLVLAALAPTAQAHVGVQPASAMIGATETLSFIVGHGCDGQPTTALRVELPAGLEAIEPQVRPGWTQSLERLPGGGAAVTWRGELAPHQAEGFAVRAKLPATPGPLVFKAAQSCGGVTVLWDQVAAPGGPRPAHPAPSMTLTGGAPIAGVSPLSEHLPAGVNRLSDGSLADGGGRPLYTFNFDTMVGMSHCESDCADLWPPLLASKGAKPFGTWTLVVRENGALQWALRDKPLYTYSRDRPGQPAMGTEAPNWTRAK